MSLAHLSHRLDPHRLPGELRRLREKWWRRLRRVERRRLTLDPQGPVRGRVLFSYIVDPFLLPPARPLPHSHTHYWESLTMARSFQELGYRVDVVHWTNTDFVPEKPYDLVVDVRLLLERWAEHLPAETIKVLHAETAHHSFHNAAQARRLRALEERRGVRLEPVKMIEPNRAAETADVITILGNEFTQETYAFAGKPLLRVPISAPFTYPWPTGKRFGDVRRRFLWLGSGGLVHKGLDLVLEAFAGMPGYHLTVCGPIGREPAFERAYFRELYRTPNIRTVGWVDVGSPAFLELARGCLGLVYPSCSEGGGGSVLTCMHAGLVPLVTREASVDVEPAGGVELPGASVAQVQEAVRALADEPAARLEERGREVWSYAREHHTQERFQATYRRLAERLAEGDASSPEQPRRRHA